MATFVLEIGSEELPSRFLPVEEAELSARFRAALDEAAVEYGDMRVMSTPRRAVVIIENVNPVQQTREEEVAGPPVRAAYDAEGKPTKALEGFARTHGLSVADVYRIQTDKGEYVAVRKRMGGAAVRDLLAGICPAVITALPFAKRMRWGAHSLAYARPLRWLVALLDEDVVPFSVGPVTSGRETCGHRIHGPGPFSLASASAYLTVMAGQCAVTVDPAARREVIVKGGNELAAAAGGRVLWRDGLLEEVQGLVEHPVPLLGDFDPAYLEVPAEVLLTSMESHQKSFGIEDAQGRLMPHFLTVLNLTPQDMAVVKHGWERVLRARLEDARFFWHQDLRDTFDNWLEKLEHVIFIARLGSMADKTRRLEALCRWLAESVADGRLTPEDAARAGRLSKADLVSGMVGEFDTLQGIMGGIYADRKGESPVVAQALREQYLPAGPESPLPSSLAGALLSLADKADTLAGCFGLGMIPTGAADPNGLRRCALGIIRIALEYGLALDVRELLARAHALYGDRAWKLDRDEALGKLAEFFTARLRNYWQSRGEDTLLVDAALGAGLTDVPSCAARLAALRDFSRAAGYAEAVQTFKRVANILRKQGGDGGLPLSWDGALLREAPEKALAATLDELLPRLDALWEKGEYAAMLNTLGEVRPAVDAFFDGVMVMAEEAELRRNRLAMLNALGSRFARLADFAALQI
ncbi:MAG TPA: glycine--tRNA ligase subunit beta [Candidatus Desulfovibrio intestinavium]|uniref:Glycine--tRNA ligase beta subunit n=1 Tax=Candidatus Desulfovibrio intestinavium TaxID=2838534 RepID=A0A9D2KP77_9BACT|nr:glycine--tRNA ligase subunit beta [Candidatus Desulfovibrio intestinavium]